MSRKTINAILSLAATDENFCQELLKNPLAVAQKHNFKLTKREQEVFKEIVASDLSAFSHAVLILLVQKVDTDGYEQDC